MPSRPLWCHCNVLVSPVPVTNAIPPISRLAISHQPSWTHWFLTVQNIKFYAMVWLMAHHLFITTHYQNLCWLGGSCTVEKNVNRKCTEKGLKFRKCCLWPTAIVSLNPLQHRLLHNHRQAARGLSWCVRLAPGETWLMLQAVWL